MIARSGNMQIAPIAPVKVIRGACGRARSSGVAVVSRVHGVTYNGGFRHRPETRHSSVCPSTNSRNRSPGCPSSPGVYLYFNAAGETIYVGKARALRDRVRSYLGAYGASPKTDALLDEVARLEVIVTDSVVEALALENNLIKQRSPKYNILLRDDKNYPYLQLTTNEAFPRVLVARRVERDGSFYAGPVPAGAASRAGRWR